MINDKKNNGILVSFIITCYNLPIEMLCECLNSIISLSLNENEREIILIDDGSEVPPINDLEDYLDKIIYLRQSNKGPGMARNKGIQISSGKYIQFVDGDDYLLRTPYEHCLDIVRYNNPDIVTFMSTDSSKTSNTIYKDEGPFAGSTYMRNNNIRCSVCGYIFKKSLLIDLKFLSNIYHEDEEFTPKLLLKADKMFSTNAKAYFYRKRESSLMHTRNKKNLMTRLDTAEQVILRLNSLKDSLPISERTALERRIAQLTMDHVYNIMTLTGSSKQLEKRIKWLEKNELFPLPDKKYTKKYSLFRTLTKNKTTRLLTLLLLKNKKR